MVNFERTGKDADGSYPAEETMHDKLDEMEKTRLAWETETLRRMEEDREDAEKVTSFGKEAYEATEATHRERESKREKADKLEARKLVSCGVRSGSASRVVADALRTWCCRR
mmetsp:Transcript_15545/g.63362  ORF Transcript_15545/g.63362 Transcript_15545/m.63362 type:complete len:112 (+) Transcript_15545:575-910(+)